MRQMTSGSVSHTKVPRHGSHGDFKAALIPPDFEVEPRHFRHTQLAFIFVSSLPTESRPPQLSPVFDLPYPNTSKVGGALHASQLCPSSHSPSPCHPTAQQHQVTNRRRRRPRRLPLDSVASGQEFCHSLSRDTTLTETQLKHALPARRPTSKHTRLSVPQLPVRRGRRSHLHLPQRTVKHGRRDVWRDAGRCLGPYGA